MRLALVGAFPFPLPQGSQVYVAEQARALEAAGARCTLLSYASLPSALAPRRTRSGPGLAKPLADVLLLARLISANRRERFGAVLAHNAEAAVISILARPFTGVPVVYVAHTLLRYELSAYGAARWRAALNRIGRAIDRWIAQRADGIVALSDDAHEQLSADARCEIAVVPPGLQRTTPPSASAQSRACAGADITPGTYALYAGNLDEYQDLPLLDAAAAILARRDFDVVVATHDARDGQHRYPHLKIVEVDDFEGARALQFAAACLVLTRQRPGGFPIKLLNYLETGRPVVAFDRIAPGLEDGVHARLLAAGTDANERAAGLADALCALRDDPKRCEALGRAGLAHLESHHAWPKLAEDTLAFIRRCSRRAP